MGFDRESRLKVERHTAAATGLALWLTGELELEPNVARDYCGLLRAMVLVCESLLSEDTWPSDEEDEEDSAAEGRGGTPHG